MSSTIQTLGLMKNNLVEIGDLTVLNNLGILYLRGNNLEMIPDILEGLLQLWVLKIGDNTRMSCDRRMCWRRLWDRMRPPIEYRDDVMCMAPPAARGHHLAKISPGFIQCARGESQLIFPWTK